MSCVEHKQIGPCPICEGCHDSTGVIDYGQRNPPPGETGVTLPSDNKFGVGGQAGPGRKFDAGKDPWHLFYFPFARQVVKVLEFGARKYEPNNWQKVPDFKNRYFSSMMRHLTSWWDGETHDPESGLNHLAHAGCCLMFLVWNEAREGLMERRKSA